MTATPLSAVPEVETSTPKPDSMVESRVSFRQPVSTAGFIDAAWWPRSRDLTTELPALMDLLWTAGREITRVSYNLAAWDPAPRRLVIEGRTVRLGGFATGEPSVVTLIDTWGREHIDVLVIAPDTEPEIARRAMELASRAGGTSRAAEILTAAGAGIAGAA
jgi:Family of unknown function (DUF5994)